MSEWQQFRTLVRASLGRFMDAAVASRGIDGTQFAIWSFALVATPPILFSIRMMSKYAFMWRRPDLVERAALADRLFFIVYVMLACAFLAAMLWDALFPDRDDQEIVGVLPVRPRTLAAARCATAIGLAAAFSAALAVPSGFLYMLNVAAGFRSAAVLGSAPLVFVAHSVAVTLAGIFTFSSLLALRGIAVVCLGAQVAQRAAAALQLVTVVLLLEALIFLPGLLNDLSNQIASPQSAAWRLPPLWFMGLYAAIGGPPLARQPGLTIWALTGVLAALLVAVASYVLPAAWNARRALESRLKRRTGRYVRLARRFASPLLAAPCGRAVFAFTLASLARSRRHSLTLATYAGVAIALGAVRYAAAYVRGMGIPIDAPTDYLLSLPLVMTFFLVAALHSAFSIPTDVEGNWTFRVAQPHSTDACVHALGVAIVCVAVLPVTAGWLLITAFLWTPAQAAATAAMHAASGVALVELTLIGRRSIPFTRAHVAAVRTVRRGWLFGLVALHVFAFRLEDLQLAAMRAEWGVPLYLVAMLAVAAGARVYRRTTTRHATLEFDPADVEAPATLNLSQATG